MLKHSQRRCLINNTLESFRTVLRELADQILLALEESINAFFVQTLQLDSFTLELEARADKDPPG